MAENPLGPALIWGMAFTAEGARELAGCDDGDAGGSGTGFRWLHLSLADLRTRRWLEQSAAIPPEVRELLLSSDQHQRSVAQNDCVGCVIHDFERDFERTQTDRIGAVRIALCADLVITTRLHPVRSADIARRRIEAGAHPESPAAALDLMVGAIAQNIGDIARSLEREVQAAEDAFLDGHHTPTSRELITLRRRLAQIHRLLDGMRSVFQRLERDSDVPPTLQPVMENLSQRLLGLDGDIMSIQGQLRVLRDEIDIQQEQRTNQNLYLLSIMTALMLPTTLVTGVFGMNTGGMGLQGPGGTLIAVLLALAAAAGTYALLRWMGFIRR
ncbi:CorA family divalent cation transporter [Novosphingobium sp. JCM 18896]|uniref:CorA family divalent cation transporter n=1 Tax=Novosphingobium sp. JCM 18896 TaxID=2989731 RepID=UPI0022212F2E|nr:CorA family divalent cation transporter [Novosphingobium sp. JCM 18896]MCW1430574.1 magnesium transporter CorA [Novosphingobium sp. JCM 18896]